MSPQVDVASDLQFDELAAMGAPEPVAATPQDEFTGKTPAELAAMVSATRDALKISEQARTAPPVEPPKVQEALNVDLGINDTIPTYTKESIDALMEENPAAAAALLADIAAKKAVLDFSRRVQPLINGSVSAAEASARSRHAEEFELFGDQIRDYASKLPDKSPLARPEAWDDLVAYTRGRPENFKKLVDAQVQKALAGAGVPSRSDAQAGARATAPMTIPTVASGVTTSDSQGLDATALEICRVAGLDPREYKKYYTPAT